MSRRPASDGRGAPVPEDVFFDLRDAVWVVSRSLVDLVERWEPLQPFSANVRRASVSARGAIRAATTSLRTADRLWEAGDQEQAYRRLWAVREVLMRRDRELRATLDNLVNELSPFGLATRVFSDAYDRSMRALVAIGDFFEGAVNAASSAFGGGLAVILGILVLSAAGGRRK